jgi:hypothetical protein
MRRGRSEDQAGDVRGRPCPHAYGGGPAQGPSRVAWPLEELSEAPCVEPWVSAASLVARAKRSLWRLPKELPWLPRRSRVARRWGRSAAWSPGAPPPAGPARAAGALADPGRLHLVGVLGPPLRARPLVARRDAGLSAAHPVSLADARVHLEPAPADRAGSGRRHRLLVGSRSCRPVGAGQAETGGSDQAAGDGPPLESRAGPDLRSGEGKREAALAEGLDVEGGVRRPTRLSEGHRGLVGLTGVRQDARPGRPGRDLAHLVKATQREGVTGVTPRRPSPPRRARAGRVRGGGVVDGGVGQARTSATRWRRWGT